MITGSGQHGLGSGPDLGPGNVGQNKYDLEPVICVDPANPPLTIFTVPDFPELEAAWSSEYMS